MMAINTQLSILSEILCFYSDVSIQMIGLQIIVLILSKGRSSLIGFILL